MAMESQQDFNRSALTIREDRAWYTGQQAEKIPAGLLGVVGINCTSLDLSYNELTSVSGVKGFQNLQELILDNNKLRNLKTLPCIPKLKTLSLNKNRLTDIDDTLNTIKRCCPNVTYVSLLGNPGCPDQLTKSTNIDDDDYERYRLYAIYILPSTLQFLDSRRITNEERSNAENRGKFSKIVKIKTRTQLENALLPYEFKGLYFDVNCSPLPQTIRTPQDHKGAYGKCKYRYSGKNSEGNRFISNNDL